ncbi:MAG: hypothetical protein V4519_02470 [Patescibacteria group bacterium]
MLIELTIALALSAFTVSIVTLSLSTTYTSVERTTTLRAQLQTLVKSTQTIKNLILNETATTSWKNLSYSTPCLVAINAQVLHADTQTLMDYGDDCGGIPIQQSHSITFKEITVPNATSLDVLNDHVYVGALVSSTTEPSLYIFPKDISDTSQAIKIHLNQGIRAVDVTQSHMFIAATGTTTQFHIVDIAEPLSATSISKATLPGVSGSYPDAISIQYYRSRVYIGTHRTAGREFHIFDVENPSQPVWLGSREINHNINDITVDWPYAYLATSGNTKDVIILNVSNPSSILEVSSISFSGNEDSQKIIRAGDILYIGRKRSTLPQNPEFVMVDSSNPLSPTLITSAYFKSTITGFCILNSSIYASLTTARNHISKIDVATTSQVMSVPVKEYMQAPKDIDCEGTTITTLL